MKNTLYTTLGVDRNASFEEIVAAYRMRLEALGEVVDYEAQNEAKFVREAYAVLSDPKLRSKYDDSLNARTALENTVIFYSGDMREDGMGWPLKILILVLVCLAVYGGYRYYFQSASADVVSQQEISTSTTATQTNLQFMS